jgi:hypothetical protein
MNNSEQASGKVKVGIHSKLIIIYVPLDIILSSSLSSSRVVSSQFVEGELLTSSADK